MVARGCRVAHLTARISKGETVRFVNFGTPSQRRTLWVLEDSVFIDEERVIVHRQEDPSCWLKVRGKHLEPASLLDLIVAD